MSRIELSTPASGTLNLNEQAETLTSLGMQVHAGITGLGLPPVATQWLEGAGDGALYRGSRMLYRDIDLPITVRAQTRANLLAAVRRLNQATTQKAITFRFIDDEGLSWVLTVQRVGGGDYAYGHDTDGTYEAALLYTLRAGEPFWTREGFSRSVTVGPTQAIPFGNVSLTNDGDIPVKPTWTIYGPATSFVASIPGDSGTRTLKWQGSITAGQWIIVKPDLSTGGNPNTNRYSQLVPPVDLWPVPTGITQATITVAGGDSTNTKVNLTYPEKRLAVL